MIKSSEYNNLLIKLIIYPVILLFATALYAGDVTVSWDPPTTNEDTTPLTDLSGYILYYGTTPGDYFDNIDVGNVTTYQVNNLTDGLTYYFAVTAYNTSRTESEYSDEEVITINPPPSPEITVTDSISPANDNQILFGNVTENSTSNQTVTITNDGNEHLVIGSIAQSNSVATPFSIINDYCSGQTLTQSSNCNLTVRFSPTFAGTFSDSFDIPSNDSDEDPVTIALSGTGDSLPVPDITVADSVSPADNQQIPFGSITVTSSSNQTVTVTNDGNANLTIGNIAQSNPTAAPFSILNNNCSGQTLSPSSSCTLTVRFSPSSTGTFSDSFDIPSNDSDENPVTVSISGTGDALPVPDITVTDSIAPTNDQQISFGSITESSSSNQTVTVTNDGNANLTIGNIAQSNPTAAPFSILNNNCSGQTLSPSSSCTLTVRFSPSSTGTFSDSFDIPSNDSDENPVTVSISGTGDALPVPDITVTDSIAPTNDQQMPFEDLAEGLTSDRTVTISNYGNANLNIGNIAQSNALAAPFSIINDNCSGQTFSPSSSCTLTVSFSPDTMGIFSDSFNIPSNDPDEDPTTVTVSGTGLSAAVNNAPSTPRLVFPANGQEGVGETVDFQWEESVDPDQDQISYYLYYGNDSDFSDDTPIIVASLNVNNVQYASIGSSGTILVIIGLFSFFMGMAKSKKRACLLIISLVITGMLLISCGDVEDLVGDSIPFGSSGGGGSSHVVSGLASGSTYCWKVVADDGNGGTSESDTNCFGT
ncbi:MAG: choice-of-anchor D domain-containing protein [Nitrospirota bacterium]